MARGTGGADGKRKREKGDEDGGGRDGKRKRDKEDSKGGEGGVKKEGGPSIGQQTSRIGNKLVRSELYSKLKHKQKKQKKTQRAKRQKEEEAAKAQGLEPPPRKQPKTIENTREKDETMVLVGDEEVAAEEEQDEFSEHFASGRPPKVMLTTSYKPSKIMYTFLSEMLELLPHAEYYARSGYPLKKIVQYASNRGYTDLLVFNEDSKQVNAMLAIHLPDGPTARFRLSNLILGKDIRGHGRSTGHKPELILNNFGTRLGRRVGRMFASLFTQDPNFRGRQVVTFHNQRDFIFVRHHRYIFQEKSKKQVAAALAAVGEDGEEGPRIDKLVGTRLQELGPRFTLKLEALQKGTFDSKGGEFEWVHKKDMDTSRRKFFL